MAWRLRRPGWLLSAAVFTLHTPVCFLPREGHRPRCDGPGATPRLPADGPCLRIARLLLSPTHAAYPPQGEMAAALPEGVLRTSHRFLRYAETEEGVVAEFDTPGAGTGTFKEEVCSDGTISGAAACLWTALDASLLPLLCHAAPRHTCAVPFAAEGLRSVHASLLLGCDGGQSAVREQLLGDGPPQYLGEHAREQCV